MNSGALQAASGIDIIGDIHGHASPLQDLLIALGYEDLSGTFRHSKGRKALFLGDLIDRGPANVETVKIVRQMVEAGEAVCLAGNHEFNAVHFSIEHPENKGQHLRPRTDKNLRQHLAFLNQYHSLPDGPERLAEDIAWFRTLPLWIELPGLRAVHACWSEDHLKTLNDPVVASKGHDDTFWHRSANKKDKLGIAADVVLKGAETDLPEGISFRDKDRNIRTEARVAWWVDEGPWPDRVLGPPDFKLKLEKVQSEPDFGLSYSADQKPVFFGHYWFKPDNGRPYIARHPNVCCLDFSVARPGGILAAYQWDGEDVLDETKLAFVNAQH